MWAWALAKFTDEHPHLGEAELVALTSQYSSDPRRFDPDDPTTWPTHASGGSVDVMLRSLDDGVVLNMGAAFDELGDIAHTDHLERLLRDGQIDPDAPALRNRRLLYNTMTTAGFANYPAEFWHYDFGNQMHAFNTGSRCAACYGYVTA
ncbi:MAG: M15 family metallopeptidase [Pseudomonadota bacterium]